MTGARAYIALCPSVTHAHTHTHMYVHAYACIRRKTGMAVGLMVTASHNAEPDNGIKMVDPNGGMLSQDWEGYAEVG